MIEFLSRASSIHAMVVHFPLALSFVAIPLVYLCVAGRGDRNEFRWLAAACYGIILVTAIIAVQSGERAMEHIPATLSPDVWATVERHEAMAEKVWIFSAATGLLLVVSTLRIRTVRMAAASLAVISSVLTAGWIGITGHYGGTLVYEHGVGTPAMNLPAPVVAAPAAPAPEPAPVAPPPVQETPVSEPASASDSSMAPAPADSVSIEPAPFAPAPEAAAPATGAQESTAPESPAPETSDAAPAPETSVETTPAEALTPAIRDFALEEAKQVSYVRDVVPILELHCVECHNPDKAKGDFDATSVPTLILPGKKAGPGVLPGKPDESSIVEYIRGAKRPQMPKGEEPISEQELHIIRMWIAAGALDDTAPAPVPVAQTAEAPAAQPAP